MKNGERETTASVFFCAVTPAEVSLSPLAGRGWGEGRFALTILACLMNFKESLV
jgi:hypothetical protein